MSSYLYYKSYTKIQKPKIQDESIPLLIKKLLRDAPTSDAKTFLDSLMNYYNAYGGLTPKQLEALKDVEGSVVERASAEHNDWIKEYDEEMTIVLQNQFWDLNIDKKASTTPVI